MDDSNADYLTKYREFIESLLKTSDLDYPLPVSVAKYNIAEFEITGEVLNWCLTYLNERNCPNSLAAPLCCKVLEEILQVAKEDPESCGYRTHEDDFQPLKLMQKTIKKLIDVCIYYSDNAKLSTLLPPPAVTLLDPPVSVWGVKNSRRKMEDRHVAIQDLHALYNVKECGSASYYAVFDGHNGMDAAAYSSCHVHQYLVESSHYPHNPELALKEAFTKTDDRFVDKSNKENLDSGTTALCALLRPNESMLYVAWLGDSQAVLVSQGKAYQLVKPHRPDQPDERDRIINMGGTVLYMGTWRVNGHLAVSRAIGDRRYKPFVMGEPDVRVIPLTGKEEFLILGSDGLWDFVPENEAVNAVYDYLQTHKGDVGGISKHLVQLAKSRFSRDNISVVVVFLSEPEPYKGGRMEASEVEHIWRDSYVTKTTNGQFNHDDDDFGPETDVDGVHDVLTSGFSADAAKAKALVVQSQAMEEWLPSKFEPSQKEFLQSLPWTYADALKKPKPDSPKKAKQRKDIIIMEVPSIIGESVECKKSEEDSKLSVDMKEHEETATSSPGDAASPEPPNKPEETGNDVVAAEVEDGSEDDSEDEWNYVSGKNNKKPDKKPQVEAVERSAEDQRQGEDEIDDEDDMSRLNPDAAPFVPVFGEKLDKVLASSPAKGAEKSLEDVQVPQPNDFLDEIASKPSDLGSIGYEVNLNDISVNGIDVTVDSTKAEYGDDISDEDLKETIELSPTLHSPNPFAEDTIQHQMVSNYFSGSQNLEFKTFDPMQASMVVFDSTPSPNAPPGDFGDFGSVPSRELKGDFGSAPSGDLCDYGQNDKPDLLSPIDNLTTPNDQQTPSSGFESEPGADESVSEKCDLVAGIPQDGAQHVANMMENQHDDRIDTNPFSMDSMQQIPMSFEQTGFFDKPSADANILEAVQEEKTSEEVDQSCQKPAQTLDQVDLISGMASESSCDAQQVENPPKVDFDTLPSDVAPKVDLDHLPVDVAPKVDFDTLPPDVAQFGHVEIVVHSVENVDSEEEDVHNEENIVRSEQNIVHSEQNDVESEEIVACEEKKEQNLLATDERLKGESGDSDGFEIISHEEAEIGHHAMNGVHLEDDSPDNYKMDDFVQHSVQIHEAPKSLEESADVKSDDFFGSTGYRQELNASAVESSTEEAPKDFLASFDGSEAQQPELPEIQQPDVPQTEIQQPDVPQTEIQQPDIPETEIQQPDIPQTEIQQPDVPRSEIEQEAFVEVFTKSSFSAEAAEFEPKVEEIISQVEDMTLEDKITIAEPVEEVLVKSEPEAIKSESSELLSNAPAADSPQAEELHVVPDAEELLEVQGAKEPPVAHGVEEPAVVHDLEETLLVHDAKEPLVTPDAKEPLVVPDAKEPLVVPDTKELPVAPDAEELLTAPVTESPLTEELPTAPSTPLVEEQPEKVERAIEQDAPAVKLESPVELSEAASEETSTELPVEDFGKQNGHIADISTPPSTPAPGVQTDETKDGLIAAAVAAAGAATVVAAAAVASKAEDKVEKKPAAGKTAAKPTAAKAPAKPSAAASAAKKPTTTAKAPVTVAKSAPAKPLGAVKASPAKPAAAKPASPLTKTATATTARPKPATTTAAKPAAPKPAGVAAKPGTTAARPAPAAAKAPLTKPKTPTTTVAPIKKPSTTTVTKTTTTTTTVAKKPEPAKPLAAKPPARTTTTTAARPTSASKPASATSTTRPSSATKPAAKPLTTTTRTTTTKTTTTTAARPAAPRVPATATKAPAKPTTPVSKTAPATKAAPPKPRPAAPTSLKKPAVPAAADKNKEPTKPAPIRKPVDKTKPAEKDVKPADKDQIEPPMQEPIVSTTNGHIENGILSDESPIDIDARPIVEAQN